MREPIRTQMSGYYECMYISFYFKIKDNQQKRAPTLLNKFANSIWKRCATDCKFLFITVFRLTRTREESFLLCCNFITFLTFTHPLLNIYGDGLCLLIRTCVMPTCVQCLFLVTVYSRYDFSKNQLVAIISLLPSSACCHHQLVAIVAIQLWIDAFMIAMIPFQLLRSEFCHEVIALL